MARIRSIHPGMASDEAYMAMSFPAQAGWPMLWTESDDHGVFEWKPIVLKARIFPAANLDFSELMAEWERLGCIKRIMVDGKPYGLVRNFCRYQRPKNPSYRFTLPDEEREYVGLKPVIPPALPQHGGSPPEICPQMEDEGGRREEEEGEERNSARAREVSEFEEFYRTYPRHEGKGHALKAYRSARKKLDAAGLLDAAQRAREKYSGTEPRFIPLPASWLNGERWADEPGPQKSTFSETFPEEIYRGVM